MAEKMGILGRKLGMTRIFGDDGASVAVTVIQAGPCPVTQVKTEEKHVSKAMQGHFAKAGTGLYSALREIRLAGAPEQKAGDTLTCELFKTGDVVKVTGKSIGKGYQGRMRRWNFRGCKDTHGDEKVHRNNGSIGNNTFPGHVIKGRKMAGQWGAETVTQPSAVVVDVRPEDNVIIVKGAVPGPKNGLVLIRKQ